MLLALCNFKSLRFEIVVIPSCDLKHLRLKHGSRNQEKLIRPVPADAELIQAGEVTEGGHRKGVTEKGVTEKGVTEKGLIVR